MQRLSASPARVRPLVPFISHSEMAAFWHIVVLCVVWLALVAPCLGQVPPFAPATSTPPPFPGRAGSAATTFYGRTIFIGGYNGTSFLNDIWLSRNDGASWQNVPNAVIPGRRDGALVTVQTVVNNTQLLIFIGGLDKNGVFNNDMYFSTNGQSFIPTGLATFSGRSAFAYTIALPVADQSGDAELDGLPALLSSAAAQRRAC